MATNLVSHVGGLSELRDSWVRVTARLLAVAPRLYSSRCDVACSVLGSSQTSSATWHFASGIVSPYIVARCLRGLSESGSPFRNPKVVAGAASCVCNWVSAQKVHRAELR